MTITVKPDDYGTIMLACQTYAGRCRREAEEISNAVTTLEQSSELDGIRVSAAIKELKSKYSWTHDHAMHADRLFKQFSAAHDGLLDSTD